MRGARRPSAPLEWFPIALAAAAWIGAVAARPVPWFLVTVAAVVALVRPRRLLVVGAVLLLASALGAVARVASAPLGVGPFAGAVTLVADPVSDPGRVRAEVRLPDGARVALLASGPGAADLRSALAGQRFVVGGRIEPRAPGDDVARTRHLRGTLTAESLHPVAGGPVPLRAANAVRGVLERSASALPVEERHLYLGLVIGDDRGLDPLVEDDFRAAGLSHLTAVSGENVAFVLAVAAPLLRRWRRGPRVVGFAVLLVFFAALTRFEPSVLRATVMAAIAVLAATAGRPVPAWRSLSLAVTVLVLVDPFITGSLGFQLSCAACAAIVLLARPLAAVVPGPRWLAAPLAVTVAAQAAVTPLLAPIAGPLPVSAFAANLAAVPAAGPVMVWGLTGGLVAGLLPQPVAVVVQLPARVLVGWLLFVAELAGRFPLLWLPPMAALLLLGVLVIVAIARHRRDHREAERDHRSPYGAVLFAVATIGVLVLVVVAPVGPAQGTTALGPGASLEVAGTTRVVVVDGRARAGTVLGRLRRVGAHGVDLVVVRTDGASGARVAALLAPRLGAPWLRPGTGAGRLAPGASVDRGGLVVRGVRGPDGRPAIEVERGPV